MLEEQQLNPTQHNRKAFSSGVAALDRFLQQQAHQNMRRGVSQTFVLVLAVQRCRDAQRSVGGYALIVDAKGDAAQAFYRRHGFLPYRDTPLSLYLPLGKGLS